MTQRAAIQLSLRIQPPHTDEVVGLLGLLGFEGFWEDGDYLRAYITDADWTESLQSEVKQTITEYARGHEIRIPTFDVELIPPTNWNEAWESSIKPVVVTDSMIIAPTWATLNEKPGQLVLRIDPKMSFGTGHHETTRLILRMLEPEVHGGETAIDVGTGTGVLAIAALRLGASRAVGIDVDEWSFENAKENARLNGVLDRFDISLGDIRELPPGRFTFVIANIQSSIILPALADLKSRMAPGGLMLLSGLLKTERESILSACQSHGLTVVEEAYEAEWIALKLRAAD
jgi:ribosomal protein L11 methyltransferase